MVKVASVCYESIVALKVYVDDAAFYEPLITRLPETSSTTLLVIVKSPGGVSSTTKVTAPGQSGYLVAA